MGRYSANGVVLWLFMLASSRAKSFGPFIFVHFIKGKILETIFSNCISSHTFKPTAYNGFFKVFLTKRKHLTN